MIEKRGSTINGSATRTSGATSERLPRFGSGSSEKRESIQRGVTTRRSSYSRPIKEHHDDDFYDDSIEFVEFDDEVEETPMNNSDFTEYDLKNISKKLDIVLKKLAKLEEQICAGGNKDVSVSITEGAATPSLSAESTRPPRAGSMIADIQSTLGAQQMQAQYVPMQSGLGPMSMGTMSMMPQQQPLGASPVMPQTTMSPSMIPQVDNSLSAIATMPSSAYEDDAPVVLGLD